MRDSLVFVDHLTHLYRAAPGTDTFAHVYEKLFDEYVGVERVPFLRELLKKDTYIVTLNGSVNNVHGVLQKIHPEFARERIHSVSERYNNLKDQKIMPPNICALLVKLRQIFELSTPDTSAWFADDMFSNEVFETTRRMYEQLVHSTRAHLRYVHVDTEEMSGLQAGMINVGEKDVLFLDFDDTITKETDSMVVLDGKSYKYADFLRMSRTAD